MANYTAAKTSWKSCFGCLSMGILFFYLIGAGIWFFYQKNQDKAARVEREFLQPWFTAARDGKIAEVWETLGTESYREKNTKEAVAATYRQAVEKLGPLQSATILKSGGSDVRGAKDLFSGRPGYQLVGTKWIFGEGKEVFLTFEVIDVPSQGFRVDHARLGFSRKTGLSGGYNPPDGTPAGPW